MGYVFEDATGRLTAIFQQTVPTVPTGFTFTTDPIQPSQIIDNVRDLSLNQLKKKDALKLTGSNSVRRSTVGEVAVQKIDGTTLADLTAVSDDDPIRYILENDEAFLSKKDSALFQGADSVKVGAPSDPGQARFLVFSKNLQILDGKVIFV